jgi:hypothetical protein
LLAFGRIVFLINGDFLFPRGRGREEFGPELDQNIVGVQGRIERARIEQLFLQEKVLRETIFL